MTCLLGRYFLSFFFFFLINILIYFLAVLGLHCGVRASVVAVHGLHSCGTRAVERRLGSCGARA